MQQRAGTVDDGFLLFFLAVLVAAFFAGPAALAWCVLLARENRKLRGAIDELRARAVEAPRPAPAAPTPPAPSVPVEAVVAERRESMREALRQIHAPPPPPPPPPTPTSGPSEPPPPDAQRGWEHWLGVRGAAALGAVVLVLAGLYFFRYSIEKGLLTPVLRVTLGTTLGALCVAASETVLRRRFAPLAHWIAGAGIALLYLSFWAAAARYGLISVPVAAGLMILVTATSVLLAVKRRSIAVASLGMVGGFATPILLSTGSDRPVALFSYLLVLDVALLSVARARRWPVLALLALLGTSLYQGLWIVGRMGPDRLGLGIGILIAFGALFAIGSRRQSTDDRPIWSLTRIATLVAPFSFALYFGLHASLSERFLLPGAYLGVIVLGAAFYGSRNDGDWLSMGAAAAGLGALGAWLSTHAPSLRSAWEVMGVAVVLSVALAALTGRERERAAWALPVWTLGVLGSSALWLLSGPALPVWPWLLGWAALVGVTLVFAHHTARGWLQVAALGGLGAAAAAYEVVHSGAPDAELRLLALAALGAGAGFFALGSRSRASAHAAGLFLATILAGYGLVSSEAALASWQLFAGTLLFGISLAFVALRARSSLWFLAAVLLTALVHGRHTFDAGAGALPVALATAVAAVVLFTAWALALPAHAREQAWTWRATALVGPLFFLATRQAFVGLYGDGAIALVPLGLAAASLFAAALLRRRGPTREPVRRTALVWLGAASLSFVTLAIPLQLENEWLTIAWALQGVALLALWRRLDHVGLRYFAFALLAAVTVRLISNPAVLDYHLRGSLPVLNWLSYTYLVPAACLLGAWRLLADLELARRTPFERDLIPERLGPVLARACAFFGIAVVFVWINLTIVDWFSTGPTLSVAFEHRPARDLTLSVAWALYALSLLGLGVLRASTALRALSLALLLVTCAKVFLYDLSHLADLYRVASLVGLALSLIVVSFAYQRFVFRNADWRIHAS
ncbi:MAG: hypothetical protein AMXMBFR56_67240 [Polyangiaceae bacterium]